VIFCDSSKSRLRRDDEWRLIFAIQTYIRNMEPQKDPEISQLRRLSCSITTITDLMIDAFRVEIIRATKK
jgi:hypothetical protein